MNVLYYVVSYIFPWRHIVSMSIAAPMAQTVTPYLVSYTLGSTFLVPPVLVPVTYLVVRPFYYITYVSLGWVSSEIPQPQIEMSHLK